MLMPRLSLRLPPTMVLRCQGISLPLMQLMLLCKSTSTTFGRLVACSSMGCSLVYASSQSQRRVFSSGGGTRAEEDMQHNQHKHQSHHNESHQHATIHPTKRAFRLGDSNMSLVADCYGDESHQPVIFLHGGGQIR